MYTFRGFDTTLEKFVYGTSIDQTQFSTSILDRVSDKWSYVVPETVGHMYRLNDSTCTEVYQGDILRYTFDHNKEIYHRYYVIKETENGCWAEEVWRDYELDCNTFEVTRFHNVKHAGTPKKLDTFNLHTPVKIIGNIWQNPELLQ